MKLENKVITNKKFSSPLEESGFAETKFVDCIFELSDHLTFYDCSFVGVVFIGISEKTDRMSANSKINNTLNFNGCRLFLVEFSEKFKQINMNNSLVAGLTDLSISEDYDCHNSTFEGSTVLGECRNLSLSGFSFTEFIGVPEGLLTEERMSSYKRSSFDSRWNKVVGFGAICKSSVFKKAKVNTYYLTTKCFDKSSLDLSGAKLIDDWARLRKEYSGLSLFIIFLLTVIFFLPFIFKSGALVLSTTLINKTGLHFASSPLWKVLLFGDSDGYLKYFYFFTNSLLIIYNISRLMLTISLSRIMEEEKFLSDASYQIVLPSPEKLFLYLKLDSYLRKLFYATILISFWRILEAFNVSVITRIGL